MAENILVIKHGALGDFVIASGGMRAIRAKHPDAHITLITQAFLIPLAKAFGFFDEFVVDNRGYAVADWWRVVKLTLADRKFDFIYDLQSSNRTLVRYMPLARFATRHAMNWGRSTKGGFDFICTPAKLPYTWKRATIKHVDLICPAVDLTDCHSDGKLLSSLPEKYALLIPGCSAGNEQKRWPAENFRKLTEYFAELGLKSVVLGTKMEAREINAICDGNEHAISLLGKSAIPDIPDLAMRASIVVGNDTGPTHMAEFAKANTVILFTEYDASRASFGLPNVTAVVGKFITDISYEQALEAVKGRMK